MNTKNILICSVGRRVALTKAFKTELNKLSPGSLVFTADIDIKNAVACYFGDSAFNLGLFSDPNYCNDLLEKCLANNIGLIIPTIDTELLLLSKNQALFKENGIEIVLSHQSLITTCRNKNHTNGLFNDLGLKVPELIDINNPTYPFFAKPIDGSSSKNLFLIQKENQIPKALVEDKNMIFMEYLSPNVYDEYSVDLYYNLRSELVCAVPRLRIAVRSGEISKGITLRNQVYDFVIEHFAFLEGAKGCITLQLFKHKATHEIFGIEINPRFGGGYPLSYKAGANYPSWIIKEYLLQKEVRFFDKWKTNLYFIRYDQDYFISDYEL